MTTELGLVSELDILKDTRELFAKTHWTTGTLYGQKLGGKKQFCMVGGLCHTFNKTAKAEWADTEKETPYYPAEEGEELFPELNFGSVLDAEQELARTIISHFPEMLNEYNDWVTGEPRTFEGLNPGEIETIIVKWNDTIGNIEFQERGDASYILEVMDETIERVQKQ